MSFLSLGQVAVGYGTGYPLMRIYGRHLDLANEQHLYLVAP